MSLLGEINPECARRITERQHTRVRPGRSRQSRSTKRPSPAHPGPAAPTGRAPRRPGLVSRGPAFRPPEDLVDAGTPGWPSHELRTLLTWLTPGLHALPVWTAAGTGVPGGYQQRDARTLIIASADGRPDPP
ncbi:hypothetical protein FRAHR75_390066 [Frankia sp. Hr75.2]|nr:hypothetical protein FRAHR75_390066 [Frankia sp. Hr75.2]